MYSYMVNTLQVLDKNILTNYIFLINVYQQVVIFNNCNEDGVERCLAELMYAFEGVFSWHFQVFSQPVTNCCFSHQNTNPCVFLPHKKLSSFPTSREFIYLCTLELAF